MPGSEWWIVILLALFLLGGPRLARELGQLLRGAREVADKAEGEVREVKEEIQKVAEETRDEIREAREETQKAIEEAILGPADPLRVFVCSMQEELAEERAAVAERLQQLGKELGLTRPLLFEHFPASPDTPEEVYTRAVERCDIFVIIVAEEVSPPVLREYQLALEKKKPCFCFVKSLEERSEAAERFLADVAATWAEFQTPEELAKKVVAALVADMMENYRRHRLAYADVVVLLALGERLQLDRELLERAKEQAEQERDLGKQPWEPEMVYVPAGWFWMGSTGAEVEAKRALKNETPQHRLFLKGYWIGKYPVTNAQYRRFVDATRREPPGHWKDGVVPAGKDDHPVVNVTWRDAVAYCKWLAQETGKPYRLPTEAEWEKAARGADGRQYPWGDKWDASRCNAEQSWESGDTTPVGRYSPRGDSPYGCADMAGNVWEGTSSLYRPYPYQADDGREDESASDRRVLRGGSFLSNARGGRGASRSRDPPDLWFRNGGFRCVLWL